MIRSKEIADVNSCLNRSREDEPLFILCGRDESAPAAIEAWIKGRLATGKNQPMDEQILEAHDAVKAMRAYHILRFPLG